MLRKIATALIIVPLAVVIVAFAVANRQVVMVSFDPFSANAPAAAVTLPLFALIILSLIIGVVIGGSATWLGQGRRRRSVRHLRREVDELRVKVDAFGNTEGAPTVVPHADAPAQRLRLRPPSG